MDHLDEFVIKIDQRYIIPLALVSSLNDELIITCNVDMLQRFNQINARLNTVVWRNVCLHFKAHSIFRWRVGQSNSSCYAIAERTWKQIILNM